MQVFAASLRAPAGRAFLKLMRAWATWDTGPGLPAAAAAYAALFRALSAEGWAGDAWRAHVATEVALDGNAYTTGAAPGPGLRAAATGDLAVLWEAVAGPALESVRRRLQEAGVPAAPCRELGPRRPEGLAAELAGGAGHWAALADALRTHGLQGHAGPFARHLAFRWVPDGPGGAVAPVGHPDLPAPGDLVGYEAERRLVAANTERLLAGLPAHDVLLYGDRGTGKSTTVKALLRTYGGRGLRLVQLDRGALPTLPALLERLDGATQRFIVFVDDLSFEDGETGWKDAKVALQGGLRARPANVCVYATSNRRHLVRERLSDRAAPGSRDAARRSGAPGGAGDPDDPRQGDAVEERLSLADRFGLTVVFAAPDQDLYLRIVRHLAESRGIPAPEAELKAGALRFALWQGGRSGRSARQFVDSLDPAPGHPDP